LMMLTGTLTFQIVMFDIGPRLGWVNVIEPPTLVRITFVVLSAGLGFVMGYFVPAAAAAFLQKANFLRLPDRFDRKLGPLRQSETTWDPRLSPKA
jgi:hypothetical protein